MGTKVCTMVGATGTRLALYVRVSKSDQTTEPQLHSLRSYAERRGAEAVEFIDHALSGTKDRRPALDRMLGAARRREVSAVVCTKLDRIARSVRNLTALAGELEELGVALVVVDQAIDTSAPSVRLLFNVLGSIADFERYLTVERTQAGLAAAKRRGGRLDRPPALDSARVASARRMREAGQSLRHIAGILDVSHATVLAAMGPGAKS